MQTSTVKTIVSSLAIVAAGAVLFFRYFEPEPKVEPNPHLALGQALAEQVIKLAGSSGGRVVLIAPDTQVFKYPGAELQLKAFYRAMREAKVTVAATNFIKLNPLYPPRVPAGFFGDLLRKQSDADLIVSLMGVPALTPDLKSRLPEKHARVVALCSGDFPKQINLQPLFAENVLQAAIVNRPSPGPAPQSGNLSDWFSQSFQWITAQNVADLPAVETTGK